jgi:outer membrane protein TolC
MVRHQKEAGRANELAVKQFAAQLMRTQAMEYAARQRIKATENYLLTVTGQWGDSVKRDTSIFTPVTNSMVKQGVPARLLANRPDIMRAELDLKATGADVAAAKAAFLPSLTISTNVGYNTYHPELMFDPVSATAGLLATLAGPLLNRRSVKAAYGQAKAENKEAWYRYGQQVLTACNEVRTRMSDISNVEKEYRLQEQSTAELREAVVISKDLYKAGYANYLEVVTAQQNVLDAELRLIETRKRLHLANINLYRALGGGWTRDGQ